MNIYHYRHIMAANTPGKLNIICATTHAKKPMFTRIYVITHPPRNGHTDKHKAYGNNSILNSVKAVKCNKPNKSAFIQINLTKYLEMNISHMSLPVKRYNDIAVNTPNPNNRNIRRKSFCIKYQTMMAGRRPTHRKKIFRLEESPNRNINSSHRGAVTRTDSRKCKLSLLFFRYVGSPPKFVIVSGSNPMQLYMNTQKVSSILKIIILQR